MKTASLWGALVYLYRALEPSLSVADEAAPAPPLAAGPATAASSASAANSANSGTATAGLASEEAVGLANSDNFSNDGAVESEQQHRRVLRLRRLDLHPIADPESNPRNRIQFPSDSFAVGSFNVYLGANLGDNWRALGEVRFMYLPNGATTTDTATG
jgi:hypothetical protein